MEELTKLGGSLPVPCVQELAKDPLLTSVPPRFIRHEPRDDATVKSTAQVPLVDLEKLLSSDQELDRLHDACKDWGFFQLVNHGVSDSLVERVKKEIKEWFSIPMEEKKKFWQRCGDLEGFGQAFVVSQEQKLDWGDMFYITSLPTHLRRPYLFPLLPLSLRNTLEEYSAALKSLAMKILNLMAEALGMDRTDMNVLFGEEGWQQFRMNYYPPCPQPELVMGLNSHSDIVGLTILLEVTSDTPAGLQVKKDGYWVPVTPLPNAFVVNVGDSLEILSNGVYKSIEHRATVNSKTERITVATFLSPRLDGEFGPAQNLITPDSPAQFKRMGVRDYFKGFVKRELKGKSYIEVMKIHNH